MVFAGLMATPKIFNYRKIEFGCRFSSKIYLNDLAKLVRRQLLEGTKKSKYKFRSF